MCSEEAPKEPSNVEERSPQATPRTYLSARQLAARYGVTKMTVWTWARKGTLPKPYHFSENVTRWALDEVEASDAKKPRGKSRADKRRGGAVKAVRTSATSATS